MLTIDLAKCTGCRRCEVACSFFHTGRVSNRMARIKVLNIYEIGVDAPVVCNQCEERYCLACPEDALQLGPNGEVMLSRTLCQGCGVCELSCPIGAIEIFDDIVYVCDLCGGEPKCIEACSEDAIIWHRDPSSPVSLAEAREETRRLNSSERRFAHAMKQADGLRREWFRV